MTSSFHDLAIWSGKDGSVDGSEFKRRVAKQDIEFFAACMRGSSIILAAEEFLYLPKGRSMEAYRWTLSRLDSHARSKGMFSVPRLLRIVLPRARLESRLKRFDVNASKDDMERHACEFATEISFPIGGLSRLAREIRVVRRQEAQLRTLAEEVVEKPRLDDSIYDWFDATVSVRFEKSGITTIGGLLDFLNGASVTWHKKMPRLGRPSAKYVTRWLHDHASTLGVKQALLPPLDHASEAQAVREKSTGIVPLEAFLVPDEFDGSQGENRDKYQRCKIPASTDMDAIAYWLEGFKGRSTAYIAYRRQAERVLLWSILAKRKAFSTLTRDDCDEYLNDFLANIQPAECWIGASAPRRSEHWRPFVGQMTNASRMNARSVLFTLGQYLSKHHYLRTNPFYTVSLRDRGASKPAEPDEFDWQRGKVNLGNDRPARGRQVLSGDQWNIVLDCADRLPNDVPANARLRFALRFGWETGLSSAELAEASSSDLYVSRTDEGNVWLYIRANGHKGSTRFVHLGEGAKRILVDYFELRGHGRLARGWDPGLPLLPVMAHGRPTVTGQSMSAGGIYKMFKMFFTNVAAQYRSSDPELATVLAGMATRWMRESFASNCIKAGMRVHEVAYRIGDRSIQLLSSQVEADLCRHHLEPVARLRG